VGNLSGGVLLFRILCNYRKENLSTPYGIDALRGQCGLFEAPKYSIGSNNAQARLHHGPIASIGKGAICSTNARDVSVGCRHVMCVHIGSSCEKAVNCRRERRKLRATE